MPRPLTWTDTKVCEVCGREYPRPRYRNGKIQNWQGWEARRACGPKCGQRLGGRAAAPAHAIPFLHAPCPICGGAVTRHYDEAPYRFKARATCGNDACYRAHMSTRLTKPKAPKPPKAPRVPKPPKAMAPAAPAERRVAFERFPRPASMRSTWQPIISAEPPLPPARPTPRAHVGPTPELQAAIALHPALAAALAGVLTDSWAPFGSAAVGLSPGKRR